MRKHCLPGQLQAGVGGHWTQEALARGKRASSLIGRKECGGLDGGKQAGRGRGRGKELQETTTLAMGARGGVAVHCHCHCHCHTEYQLPHALRWLH
jgi:hypothetical protein